MTNTEYAAKIDSLAVFATASASHRSRFGYQPVMNYRNYGKMIERIGRMAQAGDRMTYLASQILGKINPYGTQAQACAAVFDALAEAMRSEYRDVVGASGPEAGRPSDHQHAWNRYTKILAFAWAQVIIAGNTASVDSYGWALTELAEQEGVMLPLFR